MTFHNLVFGLSLVIIHVVHGASYANDCANEPLEMRVEVSGQEMTFTLINRSATKVLVDRDFTHWQHMYFAVLHKRGYGKTIPQTRFSGDPGVGEYEIMPGGEVVERIRLLSSYPPLAELKGTAIVFWSSDLLATVEGKELKVRLSGSVELALPVH
jgi:hypothetical protein